jgi:hypothetical protein
MATLYRNISGNLTQQLLQVGTNKTISKISLSNTHATDSVSVNLHVEQKLTGKFYLIKNVVIPVGVTLVFDNGMSFSTKKDQYSFFIKLSAADSTVDVIAN